MTGDTPGANTELQPSKAPLWMRPLVESVHSGRLHRSLRNRGEASPQAHRKAAVLMLFSGADTAFHLPPDAALLLTHRSPRLRAHAGQIAFPGGRVDPGDINDTDCALREAWEETGLVRDDVTPLATLAPVHIRATGFPVTPVLAHWHSPATLDVVNPAEADEIINAPVMHLADPANRLTVGWKDWTGPAFGVNGYLVWGFTGGLIAAALAAAGWERPWECERIVDLADAVDRSRNNERHR